MSDSSRPTLASRLLAEVVGTFLLVFFGVGAVHTAHFTGAMGGLGVVAAVWGVGVGLAIYATAAVSGAHLNPAVTLAFTVFRGFSWREAGPFIVAQTAGAFVAGASLYGLFSGWIARFEAEHGITRGAPGSQLSAMAYGEYFPNPAVAGVDTAAWALVSLPQACAAEALGTALLVFFVFALVEPRNSAAPSARGIAFPIGLAVAAIICVVAPLTQAGLNPARDFGPRLFAWGAGWGGVAIPGPRGGFFFVYVLAPMVGGLGGAAAYTSLIRRGLPGKSGRA